MPVKSQERKYRPRRKNALAPSRRAVRGRGFYKGFGKHLGSALGGLAGTVGSALTGIPGLGTAGSAIGGHLGNLGSRVTGWGAYQISKNSLMQTVPSVRNSRTLEGVTIIHHKEYICDIFSGTLTAPATSTPFTIQTFPINVGMASTFPWLSGVANNYIQYKVNGMLFEFVSSSGDAFSSTNASAGEVILATNYDSVLPTFTTKQQMLNEEFSSSNKPSQNIIHPIECDPKQTPVDKLYIRNDAPPANADLRLYDLGQFSIATIGQQAGGVNLGSLYVTYEIYLYKPSLLNL